MPSCAGTCRDDSLLALRLNIPCLVAAAESAQIPLLASAAIRKRRCGCQRRRSALLDQLSSQLFFPFSWSLLCSQLCAVCCQMLEKEPGLATRAPSNFRKDNSVYSGVCISLSDSQTMKAQEEQLPQRDLFPRLDGELHQPAIALVARPESCRA